MRKVFTSLACACASALGAFGADSPTKWFDAKISDGFPTPTTLVGGAWAAGATGVAGYDSSAGVVVLNGSGALEFEAAKARTFDKEITVTASIGFEPCEVASLPEIPNGVKSAICIATETVESAEVTNYYVLAKSVSDSENVWVKATGATPVVGAAEVNVSFKTVDDVSYVKYAIGSTGLTGEGAEDGWFQIVAEDSPSVHAVGFGGFGSVGALSAVALPAVNGRILRVATATSATMPVLVTDAWIAENVKPAGESATDEEILAVLNTVNAATGLKKWQAYVLGLGADAKLSLAGAATTPTSIDLTVPKPSVNEDAGVAVKYQFQVSTDNVTWTNWGAPSASTRVTVDLTNSEVATATYWRVQAVFTEVK